MAKEMASVIKTATPYFSILFTGLQDRILTVRHLEIRSLEKRTGDVKQLLVRAGGASFLLALGGVPSLHSDPALQEECPVCCSRDAPPLGSSVSSVTTSGTAAAAPILGGAERRRRSSACACLGAWQPCYRLGPF